MYVSALIKSSYVERKFYDHEIEIRQTLLSFKDYYVSSSVAVNPARDFSLVSKIMDYSGDWSLKSSFEMPNHGDMYLKSSYNRADHTFDSSLLSSLSKSKFSSNSLGLSVIYCYAVDHSLKSKISIGTRSSFSIRSSFELLSFNDYSFVSQFSYIYNNSNVSFSLLSSFTERMGNRFWRKVSLEDALFICTNIHILEHIYSDAHYRVGRQSIQVSNNIDGYKSNGIRLHISRTVDLLGIIKEISKFRRIFSTSLGDFVSSEITLEYSAPSMSDFISIPIEMVIVRNIYEQNVSDADIYGIDLYIKSFDVPKSSASPFISTTYGSINRNLRDSMFFEIIYSLHVYEKDDKYNVYDSIFYFNIDMAPNKKSIVPSYIKRIINKYSESGAYIAHMLDFEQYSIYSKGQNSKRNLLSDSSYLPIIEGGSVKLQVEIFSSSFEYRDTSALFGQEYGISGIGNTVGVKFINIVFGNNNQLTRRFEYVSGAYITWYMDSTLPYIDSFEEDGDIGLVDVNTFMSRKMQLTVNIAPHSILDLNDIISNIFDIYINVNPAAVNFYDWKHQFIVPERRYLLDFNSVHGNFTYKDKEDLFAFSSEKQHINMNGFSFNENYLYYMAEGSVTI